MAKCQKMEQIRPAEMVGQRIAMQEKGMAEELSKQMVLERSRKVERSIISKLCLKRTFVSMLGV